MEKRGEKSVGMALSIKNESGMVNDNINQPSTSEKPQSEKSVLEKISKWITVISLILKIIELVVKFREFFF